MYDVVHSLRPTQLLRGGGEGQGGFRRVLGLWGGHGHTYFLVGGERWPWPASRKGHRGSLRQQQRERGRHKGVEGGRGGA